MGPQFTFIPMENGQLPQGAERAVIRSHCVRGKNKQADSRRSREARRRLQKEAEKEAREGTVTKQDKPVREEAIVASDGCIRIFIPDELFRDLDFFNMAGDVGKSPKDWQLIRNCGLIKTVMYPIDRCVDFQLVDQCVVAWLAEDIAFAHSVLFTSSAIQDFARQGSLSRQSCYHLRQTLLHLNTTLSKRREDFDDGTVYIVLTLGIVASIFGDDEALRVHLAGLKQLVSLRGGLGGPCFNAKTCFKISRLDLSLYMNTGAQPRFFDGPVSWESHYGDAILFAQHAPPNFVQLITDDRMLTVFLDCRYFVTQINLYNDRKAVMSGDAVKETILSIQSRLLRLDGELDEPIDECLRLAMVGFWSSTLRIPNRPISYDYLGRKFRESCQAFCTSSPDVNDFLLWLLMIGSITVFQVDEAWLRAKWNQLVPPTLSWGVARGKLHEIMWIDYMLNEPGSQAFAKLMDPSRVPTLLS